MLTLTSGVVNHQPEPGDALYVVWAQVSGIAGRLVAISGGSAAPAPCPQDTSTGYLDPEAVAGGLNHPADGAFKL